MKTRLTFFLFFSILLTSCKSGLKITEKILGKLAIDSSSTLAFGNTFVGTSRDVTITVANTKKGQASSIELESGLSDPFSYKGGTFPGTGGTCTTVLSAESTCTLIISFTPTENGEKSATLLLKYFNGGEFTTLQWQITGTGQTRSTLSLTVSGGTDFGTVHVSQTSTKTVTVSHSGTVSATALSGSFSGTGFAFAGGSFPGTGGTCTTTLAPQTSCTLTLAFSPTSVSTFTGTFTLQYANGVATTSTSSSLGGMGGLASLSISDGSTYDFGTQVAGTNTDKTFTVSNTGSARATSIGEGTPALAAPYSFKGGVFPGTGGTCASTLSDGSTCTIVVRFSPTTATTSNDTIRVSYSDGQATQSATRAITGASEVVATLSISDGPTYDFGTQYLLTTTDKTFTVLNTGSRTASSVGAGSPNLALPFSYKGGSFPGTGGTCTSSIAGSASCTIVVSFSPTTGGSYSDTIRVSYDNTVSTTTSTRAITASTQTTASLTISDATTYDYGTVSVGSTSDKTFTVTNYGGTQATSVGVGTALSAPFSFKGGTYPGTGGSCSTTLNSGASCTIVVRYTPTAATNSSGTVWIQYSDGVSTQLASRPITGTGGLAVVSISDATTYDYGSKAQGSSTSKSFTLTNSGTAPATSLGSTNPALAAPFAYVGGTYPGTGGTCSTTLAVSGTCTIIVAFSPTLVTTSNDTIRIAYNDGQTTQTITRPVTGTGITPASLSVSDGGTYDYGTQYTGTTTDHTFTVSNSGQATATSITTSPALSLPFVYKGGSFPGTGGTCGTSLTGSSSCNLVISFSPTSSGAASDTLTLSYDNGASTTNATRALTGTGKLPAILSVDESDPYNFGTPYVGSNNDKTFTITNSGETNATSVAAGSPAMSSPYSFKGGSYPGTGGTCGSTINFGTTCTVVVRFSPSSVGTFSETMRIAYNNAVSSQQIARTLTGQGVLASLSFSDGSTYDYGAVSTSGSSNASLTVENTGGGEATLMQQGSPAISGEFTFVGGVYPGTGGTCGTNLAAASSCTLVVRFTPSSTTTFNATLKVQYSNGQSTQNASIALSGTGAVAVLAISDGPTYGYGTKYVSTQTDKSFTVTNSGGTQATSVGAGSPALGSGFAFAGGTFPGTGGTCSNTLNSGDSCTIVVRFQPTTAGSYSDTVRVGYHDGSNSLTASRALTGTAITAAVLSISDGSTYAFGGQYLSSNADKTFTLTNYGGSTATSIAAGSPGLSSPFSYVDTGFPGTGGTCGTTLAAGNSCTFIVRFSTNSVGSYSDTIRVDYHDSITSQTTTRAITGSGVIPASITISDGATYDFGVKAAETSTNKTFTLTNSGPVSATSVAAGSPAFTAHYTFKGGSFPGTGGTCTGTLSSSSSCTVVVNFTPTYAGTLSDTLRVQYNDGVSTVTATRAVTATVPSRGSLDTGFNGTGKLSSSLGSEDDLGRAVGLQADGKIIVAGQTQVSGVFRFAVARYNTDGSLDGSFGSLGVKTISINGNEDRAYAVAVDSSDRIIVGGFTNVSGANNDLAIVRLTVNGSLDSSFNGNGIFTASITSNDDKVQAVAVDSSDNVVFAGYADMDGAGNYDMVIGRVSSTGSLDTSFNSSGYRTVSIGSGDERAQSVAIQSDGKIVAGGFSDSGANGFNFAAVRVTSAGALDTGFNGTGKKTLDLNGRDDRAYGIAVDSNGKIVLAGHSEVSSGDFDVAIVRLSSAGAADNSFGTSGITTFGINTDDRGQGLKIDPNGKIYVVGYTDTGSGNYDFLTLRFTSSGGIDTTFNDVSANGYVTTAIGSGIDRAFGITQQTDYTIVVVGEASAGASYNFGLTRYWP